MKTTRIVTPALTAAGILAAALQPALADPLGVNNYSGVVRTVHIGDLDLATPAGKQALRARVKAAAAEVCYEIVPATPGELIANGVCRRDVTADALDKVLGKSDISTEKLAATHKVGRIALARDGTP